VHGQVHLAGQQRLLDLLEEGALAPDALQPAVEDPVAGGGDLVELDLVALGSEEVSDVLGLPERQDAGAGAYSNSQVCLSQGGNATDDPGRSRLPP
jgi:hypothetical protein